MTILHVITRLILGGAQQNTVYSCAGQATAGHKVHLAYGPIYGPEGSLLDEAKRSGAKLHEIPALVRPVQPWKDLACYRALRKLIREIQPDIVHTHSSKAGIVGRFAGWRERGKSPRNLPKVVHTIHGLAFHGEQHPAVHKLYVGLERICAKRCDKLVAVSRPMVDAFVEKSIAPESQCVVIPSGVDLNRFAMNPEERARRRAKARLELGIPAGVPEAGAGASAPVVALIARLDPLKGQRDLLEMLPEWLRAHPTLRILLIGDGFDRPEVERRIASGGHQQRVKLLGLVDHARVPQLLPAADVSVLPSYQEGQPRTLIESLLCGCAVAAYSAGGVTAIVEDGVTGRCVPIGDKPALAQAVLDLLADPERARALTNAGAERVRQRFGADAMVAQLDDVYRSLLDPPA
ncbi:MAG: glycosyltransferase family 4 protein [Planctomycetota bacterium]